MRKLREQNVLHHDKIHAYEICGERLLFYSKHRHHLGIYWEHLNVFGFVYSLMDFNTTWSHDNEAGACGCGWRIWWTPTHAPATATRISGIEINWFRGFFNWCHIVLAIQGMQTHSNSLCPLINFENEINTNSYKSFNLLEKLIWILTVSTPIIICASRSREF